MEKLIIFSDVDNQRVRILISKGSRADMLLEMSNARQSEPLQADLNLHMNLPAICYAPYSFIAWAHSACGFISRQSALIAWYNALLWPHSIDDCGCNDKKVLFDVIIIIFHSVPAQVSSCSSYPVYNASNRLYRIETTWNQPMVRTTLKHTHINYTHTHKTCLVM